MSRKHPSEHGITWPRGFRAAGGAIGIKISGKPDLALIVADGLCTAAGVTTRNKVPSAPVLVSRRHLRAGGIRGIVCNSGNANADTGPTGEQHAIQMCLRLAERVGPPRCTPRQVLPCSTGVIGHPLPMGKILAGIDTLVERLGWGPRADREAARAIMTTDLAPKQASRSVRLGPGKGNTVRLAGIAKGSGMIAPNMATMLAFITTDAVVAAPLLKRALRQAVAESFNRISVDQHTSPSDTVLILASGRADTEMIEQPGGVFDRFRDALAKLCGDLAYQIVKDGEGATRVFRVRVTGARSVRDADRVGKAIVDSPLVKTAVHGQDPNWGRITTAAGYSGAAVDAGRLSLSIGSPRPNTAVCVYEHGGPVKLSAAKARRLARCMAGTEVVLRIDLGLGDGEAQWLGCDLSRRYVAINADYTT